MKKNFVIILIFFLGLVIMLYPIISNFLMVGTHANVITKYEEQVEKLTEVEKKKLKEEAKKYNEENVGESLFFKDPFGGGGDVQNTGYYNVLDIGKTIGSIEIPKLTLELPIYHGVSEDVLNEGVGHLSNSSFPIGGENTHSILSAHRGLPTATMFRHLDELKLGDKFYLHVLNEVMAYEIIDIAVVLPNETNNLTVEKGKDLVTLVTCDPYMINTHRLLVKGERVAYAPEVNEIDRAVRKPLEKPKNLSLSTEQKIILGLSLVAVLVLIIVIVRKRKKKERQYEA